MIVRFLKWALSKFEPQKAEVADPSPWSFSPVSEDFDPRPKRKPRVAKATTRTTKKPAVAAKTVRTKKAK